MPLQSVDAVEISQLDAVARRGLVRVDASLVISASFNAHDAASDGSPLGDEPLCCGISATS